VIDAVEQASQSFLAHFDAFESNNTTLRASRLARQPAHRR
jgi:hypothetical protein